MFGFFNAAKLVYIMSDNASKHFKSKATFEYIVKCAIELLIIIYWLMYTPNHGWSLCDERGGLLSQK